MGVKEMRGLVDIVFGGLCIVTALLCGGMALFSATWHIGVFFAIAFFLSLVGGIILVYEGLAERKGY